MRPARETELACRGATGRAVMAHRHTAAGQVAGSAQQCSLAVHAATDTRVDIFENKKIRVDKISAYFFQLYFFSAWLAQGDARTLQPLPAQQRDSNSPRSPICATQTSDNSGAPLQPAVRRSEHSKATSRTTPAPIIAPRHQRLWMRPLLEAPERRQPRKFPEIFIPRRREMKPPQPFEGLYAGGYATAAAACYIASL